MTDKPSREEVLRVAGEPVVVIFRNSSGQIHLLNGQGDAFDMSKHIGDNLYTEAQALAMYAAGAEDMQSKVDYLEHELKDWRDFGRAISEANGQITVLQVPPATTNTNTEGEQDGH